MFLDKVKTLAATSDLCQLEFVADLKKTVFNLDPIQAFHKAYKLPSNIDIDESLRGQLKWYVQLEREAKEGGVSLSVSVPDGQKVTMIVHCYDGDEQKTVSEELVIKEPTVEIEGYGGISYRNPLTLDLYLDEIYFNSETKGCTIVFKVGSK